LTYTVCYNVLEKLKNNKSPGNDDLKAEFSEKKWPKLVTFHVDSFNAAHMYGNLSIIYNGKGRLFLSSKKKTKIEDM